MSAVPTSAWLLLASALKNHVRRTPKRTQWSRRGSKGTEIIYQPPYSPELQPAEYLWGLSDEPLKNHTFDSLDALEQTLDAQCVTLMADPERVKAHTLFHWWPRIN